MYVGSYFPRSALAAALLTYAVLAGGCGDGYPSEGQNISTLAQVPASPTSAPVPGRSPAPTSAPVNVPYAVPSDGQAVTIGVTPAAAVRPAGYSSLSWGYSLFNSYGTGSFVPDYSFAGAFVIAGSGGHGAPGNVDAAIFDFADGQWKRQANANGITPREADYSASETTGAPYFELPAGAGQIPSPAHLYQTAAYVPAALGGGPKGSYLKMGSAAVTTGSGKGGGIHRMDLSTGLWTRVTSDLVTFNYSFVSSAVFDPVANRYYFVRDDFCTENSLQYLDAADWRMKRTQTFAYPPCWQGPGYQTVFLDPVRRLLIAQRQGFPLLALDLNNFAAGWVTLTMSGTQPAQAENRWVYYEPGGSFYTRGNKAGQALSKLTPPSGDWKTGTWTYSTDMVSGAMLPNHTAAGGEVSHYGTLFYVPYLQALAWIAGEASPVILLKPPR